MTIEALGYLEIDFLIYLGNFLDYLGMYFWSI